MTNAARLSARVVRGIATPVVSPGLPVQASSTGKAWSSAAWAVGHTSTIVRAARYERSFRR